MLSPTPSSCWPNGCGAPFGDHGSADAGPGVCSSVAERIRPTRPCRVPSVPVGPGRAEGCVAVAAILGAGRRPGSATTAAAPGQAPAQVQPSPVHRVSSTVADAGEPSISVRRAVGGLLRPGRRSRVGVPHRPRDEHDDRDVAGPRTACAPATRSILACRPTDASIAADHRDPLRPVPRRRPRRPLGRLPAGRPRMRRSAQRVGARVRHRAHRHRPRRRVHRFGAGAHRLGRPDRLRPPSPERPRRRGHDQHRRRHRADQRDGPRAARRRDAARGAGRRVQVPRRPRSGDLAERPPPGVRLRHDRLRRVARMGHRVRARRVRDRRRSTSGTARRRTSAAPCG